MFPLASVPAVEERLSRPPDGIGNGSGRGVWQVAHGGSAPKAVLDDDDRQTDFNVEVYARAGAVVCATTGTRHKATPRRTIR